MDLQGSIPQLTFPTLSSVKSKGKMKLAGLNIFWLTKRRTDRNEKIREGYNIST